MPEKVIRASMPWAIVIMAIVFIVGTIAWVTLDPVATWMLDFTADQAANEDAEKGTETVRVFWDYWPFWFLAMLGVFGLTEAVIRSTYRGGI